MNALQQRKDTGRDSGYGLEQVGDARFRGIDVGFIGPSETRDTSYSRSVG